MESNNNIKVKIITIGDELLLGQVINTNASWLGEQLNFNGFKLDSVITIGDGEEDILNALDAIQAPMSLYEPVFSDSGDTLYLMDQVSDKKNREENWIEELSIKEALKNLTKREQNIIELRFFHGKTQMEVAEEINISQAQVSRLEKSALKGMKQYLSDRFTPL